MGGGRAPAAPDEHVRRAAAAAAAGETRRQARLATAECTVEDLGARGEIATGICFLDHMIDQLQSTASWASRCAAASGTAVGRPGEPLGAPDEAVHIVGACGEALGRALRRVALRARTRPPTWTSALFCPWTSARVRSACSRPSAVGRRRRGAGPRHARRGPAAASSSGPSGPHTPSSSARSRARASVRSRAGGRQRAPVLESAFKARARWKGRTGSAPRRRGAAGRGPRRRARRVTKGIGVEVDLDAAYAAADDAAGAEAAWDGAAKRRRSSRRRSARCSVATGVDGLDRLLGPNAAPAAVRSSPLRRPAHRRPPLGRGRRHLAGQCCGPSATRRASAHGVRDAARGGVRVRAVLDLSNRPHVTSDLRFDEGARGPAPGQRAPRADERDGRARPESLALEPGARCTWPASPTTAAGPHGEPGAGGVRRLRRRAGRAGRSTPAGAAAWRRQGDPRG